MPNRLHTTEKGIIHTGGIIRGVSSVIRGLTGIFKYASKFNPLDLDPYLLFDAESSMKGSLEAPTLDLDPRNQETLDVITAVRAGVATYTDGSGNIATAAANTVRVDQTQGAELTPTVYQLVGNTDFTQSHWTKTASTVESGHTSPDGNANAYKLIEDTSDSVHRIFETSTVSASPNATISLFVKYSGRRYVLIRFADQSAGRWYDLINGTLGGTYLNTPNDSTIEAIGSDWYRITLTHTSTAQARCEFWVADTESVSSYTGDGESGVYIYGPQLEEGTTASSFVANTTGSPKFITGATYGPRVPMILVEPSATNLLPYSEDFSHAAWTKNNVTLTTDYGIAPDGTNTSTRIQYSGSSYILDSFVIGTYTSSTYVKGDAGQVVRFGVGANVAGGADFTLNGEWQRIEYTGSGGNIFFSTFGGNTATDFEIWGAQLETGSVATSYIPTSGSTVTRAKDNLDISGSAFTNFFNGGGDGTFYAEFTTRTIAEEQVYVLAGHSSTQRYMYSNADGADLKSYDGYSDAFGGDIQTTLNRASISYNSNTKTRSLNGSTDLTSIGTGDLRDSTRLSIGQSWSSSNQLNGHLKRVIYWPTHSDSL